MSYSHDSHPHTPGELYSCPACGSSCHCEELHADPLYDDDSVCVFCEMEEALYSADVAARLNASRVA